MPLNHRQHRELAEIERVLSGDPVLNAVAGLFPGPAPSRSPAAVEDHPAAPETHHTEPRARKAGRKRHLVLTLLAVLATLGGIATIVGAAVFGPVALSALGAVMVATGGFAVAAELTGALGRPRGSASGLGVDGKIRTGQRADSRDSR